MRGRYAAAHAGNAGASGTTSSSAAVGYLPHGDVRAAIDDIIATASLFERIVQDNRREAAKAKALGESSLRVWIQGVAQVIGGRLGGLLGTIAGAVARKLFG